MKRSPWVPLDANFQDDRRIVDISAEAELVYLRSLGLTKRLESDADTCWLSSGHLRKLCDKLDLDAAGRQALAAELVDVGAWNYDHERAVWVVAAWASWNGSLSEASERKRDGARRGNHRRYGHKGDVATCPICNKQDQTPTPDPVSPGGSLLAKRPDTDRFASRSTSLDVDVDVDVEEKTTPLPPTSVRPVPALTDPAVVAVADSLIAALGYVDEPAKPDERGYVARALKRGWDVEQLEDLAREALSRDDVDSPRAYLRGALKARANEDPPPRQQPTPSHGQRDTRTAAEIAAATYRPYEPPPDAPADGPPVDPYEHLFGPGRPAIPA